jgi:hypothetical protein
VVAGGSCQEMEPAVDFFLRAVALRLPCRGRNKARRPEAPFPATHRRSGYGRASIGEKGADLLSTWLHAAGAPFTRKGHSAWSGPEVPGLPGTALRLHETADGAALYVDHRAKR